MVRNSIAGLLAAYLLTMAAPLPSGQKNPGTLPARDSHDGLTVAADPWLDAAAYKENFKKKKSPMDVGVVAIDVYFRNDTDKLIRVNVDTIRLLYAPPDGDRQRLVPLLPEDVADLIVSPGGTKNPSPPRMTIPIPGRAPKKSRGKQWDEMAAVLQAAALQTDVVGPHATIHGLLYFNMGHQFDQVRYTRLYIPDLNFVEKNQPLFFFEIDLAPSVR